MAKRIGTIIILFTITLSASTYQEASSLFQEYKLAIQSSDKRLAFLKGDAFIKKATNVKKDIDKTMKASNTIAGTMFKPLKKYSSKKNKKFMDYWGILVFGILSPLSVVANSYAVVPETTQYLFDKTINSIYVNNYKMGLNLFLSKAEQKDMFLSLAVLADEIQNYEDAIKYYKLYIDSMEKFRLTINFQENRIGYFSLYDKAYGRLIYLLIKSNKNEEALVFIEQSKSKTLRESLLKSELKTIEKKTIRQNNIRQAQFETYASKQILTQDDLKNVERGLKKIENDSIPKTNAKTKFLLDNLSIKKFEFNDFDFFSDNISILNFYATDTYISLMIKNNNKIVKSIIIENNIQEIKNAIFSFKNSLNNKDELKSKIDLISKRIIEPIQNDLKGKKLLISPHSYLHNLPFAALKNSNNFLIENYSINYTYSLSFYKTLLNKKRNNLNNLQNKNYLIVGNPINHNLSLPQLDGAEKEAIYISNLISDNLKANNLLMYGHNATESFVKEKAKESNIIHLATHSTFDEKNSDDSMVLLSNDGKNDGILKASEIYTLDLSKNELLVLSSCESGALKVKTGDDLFGLSRSLYYAGAKRIINTLWKINDQSTYEIMKTFYNKFIKEKKDIDVALQLAMIEQIKKGNMNWLPFRMEGLYGTVNKNKTWSLW